MNQEPKALVFICHGYGMECSITMNSEYLQKVCLDEYQNVMENWQFNPKGRFHYNFQARRFGLQRQVMQFMV